MSLEVKRFPAVFASGTTTTAQVDVGKAYQKMLVELPSATTFNIFIQGAGADGGSFKRLYNEIDDNDAVVTACEITSATAGTNGAIVPIPAWCRYMKLEAGTAVANGATYYLIAID